MTDLAINPRAKRKFRPLQRCIYSKRVATYSTCGIVRFAAGFVLKPERQPCNSEGMPESKVQYFSSESTISGCRDIRDRKSGCGCSEGAISVDPTSKKWMWLQRGAFFCSFWRVQEARVPSTLGATLEQFGRILGSGGAEVPRHRARAACRCCTKGKHAGTSACRCKHRCRCSSS